MTDHPPIQPPLADRGGLALSEADLVSWGERFGHAVQPPLVVTLSGELGAGKTTLVRAICRGYGVREDVTSPTFALVHRYEAPRSPVYHVDLYRLNRPEEIGEIGLDEIVASDALVLIEWPERAAEAIPLDHVPISLQHLAADPSRRILYAGGHVADFQRGARR